MNGLKPNDKLIPNTRLKELAEFPHLFELTTQKNTLVRLDNFGKNQAAGLRLFCVTEGRFDWQIDNQRQWVYPGDVALVCPWQWFGNPKDMLEIGTFHALTILPDRFDEHALALGPWSGISESEQRLMGRILALNSQSILNDFREVQPIIQQLFRELGQLEFGYKTRVNQLLDELLITLMRKLTRQQNQRRDFPQVFQKLEQLLREDLEHPWTVEEMSAIVGLGSTAFTEKVKAFSGFSPLNYLINIRISEAIKLMKLTNKSLTDIALEMGFYSSQHFSTTFKKLTGYTPGQYRKRVEE